MSAERHPVVWVGQAAVVTLPAEIDISNAGQVRESLLSILGRGATLLVVDMSATSFCDSAGVNALVRAFKRAAAGGARMRLVVGTPAVRRVLAITGVDHLIDAYPTVAGAMGPADPPGAAAKPAGRATAYADQTDPDGWAAQPG